MIIKAVVLLIIELVIYWIIGALIAGSLFRERKVNSEILTVIGFLGYQILFQVCAFPFIITKRWFHELVTCWLIVIVCVIAIGVFLKRKYLLSQMQEMCTKIKEQPLCFAVGVLAVVLFAYYGMMNGRLDDDSVYYIGLANTTLDLNIMFRSNVYTGELQPSLYLRRIFATFEINAAMLAKVFEIHPILVMRVFRVVLNATLSACTLFEIGNVIYQKVEVQQRRMKSMAFMVLALYSNFLMEKTIFTSGTFLLHRTYEGKAYAAGVLVFFGIYICMQMTLEKQKRSYVGLMIVLLWASSAISSTAVVVNLAVFVVWGIAYFGTKFAKKFMVQMEE